MLPIDNSLRILTPMDILSPFILGLTDKCLSKPPTKSLPRLFQYSRSLQRYWKGSQVLPPPTSAIDDRVRFILKAMGLRPVIWNIESLDANIAVPPAPAQDAPLGIDISGQKLSVDTSFKHVQNSFTQKYDARWNYFPSKNTVAGGRFSYDGFISLEHDISDIEIQVARLVVPFAVKSGYKSVLVNACDQILPNASPYLDDNSVLTQFIKSIKLPLAAADLAAFTGSFPATPAGGASLATGTTSTPATTKSAAGVAVPFVAAAAALALLVL
ncbi:hypothetical protein BCR33DRAFT_675240 [Rhizoclosmatium globosum]|uniref:Uncharacterized protein n=1 Tax=Rhizoclosmatium globosum TaxID=329046 RepID=A0A1Y2D3N3_9FUNG|nr:hypothetical protein BCR33DRAFT_675240 [Rhizoclosmatium globosum]|eukprot:ORY53175.1 hypothetical protein BCR33DRAFT_675240 [Rhizoclosmatium globosum]